MLNICPIETIKTKFNNDNIKNILLVIIKFNIIFLIFFLILIISQSYDNSISHFN
jgi:hypothetical protein